MNIILADTNIIHKTYIHTLEWEEGWKIRSKINKLENIVRGTYILEKSQLDKPKSQLKKTCAF